jgi:signal transduction histidine kinase
MDYSMKNHCDSFIEKPFSPDQLVVEIERIKLHQLQNTRSCDLHQILPKIVHQINNPLLSISGFAELIQMNIGDADRLQIYTEKILSAVKQIGLINKEIMNAGRVDKTLTVTVTSLPGPAFVEVTVEDTGCGVREELLDKIFEPYFTDKSQGNGLGLVVIKNAVEKHGGKVLVKSQVGVGTRFTVRLPAMQADGMSSDKIVLMQGAA